MKTESSVKKAEQMERMAPGEVTPSSVFIKKFAVLSVGEVSQYSYNGNRKNDLVV